MIDAVLVPAMDRVLIAPARLLAARGVGADQVTVAGFCLGVLAVPALWAGWYGAALVLIALNRICDGLDGAVARLNGPTDRGAFLDIALDFLFYAAVPLGFALADPAQNALPAVILIASFIGTGSTFLAFSVIAAKRGLHTETSPNKGIYYLGGLTEGAETIAIFFLMCLFPGAFPWFAAAFTAACALTTATRLRMGWIAFGEKTG